MNQELFSIITPTYNCGPKLARTIESVLSQERNLFEFIVADGGSTDDTLNIIKKHTAELKWVSEKDRGAYDAMNKGIAMASGKFLHFLGAGDCLRPGVLKKLAAILPDDELALIYGNVFMPVIDREYDGAFNKWKLRKTNICHQAIFYGRGIFDRLGKYDIQYTVQADHAFNMKCFGDTGIQKKYVNLVIADFEGGGASEQQQDLSFSKDRLRLIKGYLGLEVYCLARLESLVPAPLKRTLSSVLPRIFS